MSLRKNDCFCRGCRKSGKKPFVKKILRIKTEAPRTHAECFLGIDHGRLHDIAKLEQEAYGRLRSPEVILHFGYNNDGTWPENGIKCYIDPDLAVTNV